MMTGVLRVRYAFGAVLVLFVASLVYAFVAGPREPWLGKAGRTSLALIAAGISLSLLAFYEPAGLDTYHLTLHLTTWLLGWALGLFAIAGAGHATGIESAAELTSAGATSWRDPILAGIAATIVLVIAGRAVEGNSTLVIDETLYVLQARLFGQPAFSLHFEPAVHPFFMIRQAVYVHGGMFGQYPLGWPAILAVFDKVGLLQWAGSLLGAASVVITYLLGRRLYSARVGAIAAGLLALHPLFILQNNRFWSHAGSTLFLLIPAYLIAGARDEKPDRARWIVVGVCLGVCLTIRPLTAVGVGLSLAVWYVMRSRASASSVFLTALWTAFGTLPFVLGTLIYNQATTGRALRFAYAAAMDIFYGASGVAHRLTNTHMEGFGGNRLEIMWTLVLVALPAALLVPFFRIASPIRLPFRKRTAAAFLILPVAYLYWNYSAHRFYLELFPFLFIAVAATLQTLRSWRPVVARNIGIYLTILVPSYAIADTIAQRRIFTPCRESTDAVARIAGNDRLLVFTAGDAGNREREMLFECLYLYNTRGLDGPVVVARDLGTRNSELVTRYPGYRVIRVEWDPVGSSLVVSRLRP